MAFDREGARTPVAIGDLRIELSNPESGSGNVVGATYHVQVRYSDGSTNIRSGDLIRHLTTQQINQVTAFLAAMRTKANAEILPE